MLLVAPEISSLNVTDITRTGVTAYWSTGQTRVIDSTVVYYRASATTRWYSISANEATMHTVSALQSGTQYQFYVAITSYGKTSTSGTATVTTGKCS